MMTHFVLAKKFMLLLSAVLLVLAPLAAATSPIQADLTADVLQGQGTLQAEGFLTALLHPAPSSVEPSVGGLKINADQVRIETDYADVAVVIPGVFNSQPLADTRMAHHFQANISSGSIKPGYRFDVIPMNPGSAQAIWGASCGALEPPAQDHYARSALVQFEEKRPDAIVDASNSLTLENCGDDTSLTVTGDFWFSAWAIGLEVEDAEGRHSYWSGHRDDQIVTEDRELYVYVTNGTLEMPLGTGYALFVDSGGTTEVSGLVQLKNARGSLTTPAGNVDLGGESMTIDGHIELSTRRDGGRLQVAVAGDASHAAIDGQSIAFPAPGMDDAPWRGVASLALLLMVLVTAWYTSTQWQYHRLRKDGIVQNTYRGRPRRGIVYGHRAQTAAQHGRHRRARWWSSLALRSHRGHAAYLRIRAQANAALGRYHAALKDRVLLQDLLESRHELADNACQAARMAARIPDAEAAKGWLKAAFDIDGTILLTESIDGAYDDLRKQSWFRSLTSQAEARLRAFN